MKMLYSQQITKILEQTENSLKKIFKERLNKLILYGSYARGDYDTGSDIDILMVLRDTDNPHQIQKDYINAIADICLDNNTVISILPMSQFDFENKNSPLIMNVKREGIELC